MTAKALPTRYKGCHFRSRLEARWAAFLDSLEVRWEYEKEGYDLGNGVRYLPDFWLPLSEHKYPGAGYWLEIKPASPSDDEVAKLMSLSATTGHNGFMVCGAVGYGEFQTFKTCCIRDMRSLEWYADGARSLQLSTRGEGPRLNARGVFHPEDTVVAWCGHMTFDWLMLPFSEMTLLADHGFERGRVEAAYAAARSARFGT